MEKKHIRKIGNQMNKKENIFKSQNTVTNNKAQVQITQQQNITKHNDKQKKKHHKHQITKYNKLRNTTQVSQHNKISQNTVTNKTHQRIALQPYYQHYQSQYNITN